MKKEIEKYREAVLAAFKEYTDRYDSSDTKIHLKIEHTYRVADLCEEIAKDLLLSETDVNLAWTCGMLHDIGRFEQVKRYGTFFDAKSINHAQFGADLLFLEGLYEQLVPYNLSEDQKSLVETAIRLHNMFRIPENLSLRESTFANVLRDADKLDILKVNCETPIDEVYNTPMDAFLTSKVSPEVKEAFKQHRCAKRNDRTTAIDFLVGQVCFTFELVYPKSLEILKRQGYIYKILEFQSENEDTRAWFSFMKQEMERFFDEEG